MGAWLGSAVSIGERAPAVCLIGDGGLQFTLPEFTGAVEARVPLVVLLWNNQGYEEIKKYMVNRAIEPIGVDIHTPTSSAWPVRWAVRHARQATWRNCARRCCRPPDATGRPSSRSTRRHGSKRCRAEAQPLLEQVVTSLDLHTFGAG